MEDIDDENKERIAENSETEVIKEEKPEMPTQNGDDWLRYWTEPMDVKDVDVKVPKAESLQPDDDKKINAEKECDDYSECQEVCDFRINKDELASSNNGKQKLEVSKSEKKPVLHKELVKQALTECKAF